jgi:hypothetical protein
MKDSGKMELGKEMVTMTIKKLNKPTLDNTSILKEMEGVNLSFKMEVFIQEILLMTYLTDREILST